MNSTRYKRIEAMEKVGAGALLDQTLQKLIHLHLQKYEQQLEGVQKELEPFEKRYEMSAQKCYRYFLAGEMGDSADIVE